MINRKFLPRGGQLVTDPATIKKLSDQFHLSNPTGFYMIFTPWYALAYVTFDSDPSDQMAEFHKLEVE